tara:strand:+ start:512 stop:772 length:261 start_codon:yes stop_codon:yes gene_type:complete
MIKHYAKFIKQKEMTPKQAAQSYVMEEIRAQIEEWSREGIENASEKKFVVALAKIHNKLSDSFNKAGDSMPIEISDIKIDSNYLGH